jgi:hypothetical protein
MPAGVTHADLLDQRLIAIAGHLAASPPHPFDEQRRGVDDGKWPETVHVLTRYLERFSTGRQQCDARTSRQQRVTQVGRRIHDVLTVVYDQQQRPLGQERNEVADRDDSTTGMATASATAEVTSGVRDRRQIREHAAACSYRSDSTRGQSSLS